jgi:hypothetical protein
MRLRHYTHLNILLGNKLDGHVLAERLILFYRSLPVFLFLTGNARVGLQMEHSQRRTPRFPFSGSAEVIGVKSVAVTKVAELSLYGCYLEAISSIPRGTIVTVTIRSGGECFEAKASVLYTQPTLGMGLAFREVKPEFDAILRQWLQQSLDKQNAAPSINNFESDKQM